MTDEVIETQRLLEWYDKTARAFLARLLSEDKIASFDKDRERLEQVAQLPDAELAACFLGSSGIGKSTLINALVGGTQPVVPSGGVGPLTAQAWVVRHGERPGLEVEYHGSVRIFRTIFGLQQMFKAELGRTPASVEFLTPTLDFDDDELPEDATAPATNGNGEAEISESEVERRERREQLRRRAQLLITGAQDEDRPLPYLLDSLQDAVGGQRLWGTERDAKDAGRIEGLRQALAIAKDGRRFALQSSAGDGDTFRQSIHDHATGYLAPLIKTLLLTWPSPLLSQGATLVDLPGVGIVRDVHKDITRKWIREKANALVLVVDHRGMTESLAEALKRSEFLNTLLYSADEPEDDPIVLVAVTRIDDLAGERHRQDRSRRKYEHFQDAVAEAKVRLRNEMQHRLDEIWLQDADASEARKQVVRNLLATLQVHPISAPEYAKFLAGDEDDPSFLKEIGQTGVPGLVASLARLGEERRTKATARLAEKKAFFRDGLDASLRLIEAQWSGESHAEEEVARLREDLEVFIRPLRQELANRQGGYRTFLKKQVPQRIKDLVETAKVTASKEIDRYLKRLWQAHWATLRASVRRGGRYSGASDINLPTVFALRFEEPIAEIWGNKILSDIRAETRDYANDCVALVEQVADWALQQGARVQPKVIEAQREAIRGDAKKLQSVGHEMVKEMRDEAKAQLVNAIEGPIKKACDEFVRKNLDVGAGVKARILGLYEKLGDRVTDAAEEPAIRILLRCFKEVEKEILGAFAEHQDPLDSMVGNSKLPAEIPRTQRRAEEACGVGRLGRCLREETCQRPGSHCLSDISMSSTGYLVSKPDLAYACAVLREQEEWGLRTADLVHPPRRFWSDEDVQTSVVEEGIDVRRIQRVASPAEILANLPPGENWQSFGRRSVARLHVHYLVGEDPQRRLDAREIETLSHQVSLVRHVLQSENLRRVLIADEVGLGKTIEVGLVLQELLVSCVRSLVTCRGKLRTAVPGPPLSSGQRKRFGGWVVNLGGGAGSRSL